MKKILSILVLGIMLSGLLMSVTMADVSVPGEANQPNSCCSIKHTIDKIGGDSSGVNPGDVVGPSASAPCVLGGTAKTPTAMQNWAAYCLIDSVMTVSDWIFWIAFVIAGIIIVLGAIQFMTASGNPEKASKAKKFLTYGIIGIAVAIVARFIPGIVRFFVGM